MPDPHDTNHAIDAILSSLDTDDLLALIGGASFWHTHALPAHNLPAMQLADGPHGLRKQPQNQGKVGPMDSVPATCFPTAAALACSWDTTLLDEVGHAMGREAMEANVGLLLGPGANIKRHPHCGRNFEYFSEDPYLSGMFAAAMIQGIQRAGVGACPKHFVANNQELQRQVIDVIIDQRALHEIYLAGFAIAVQRAKPWALMAAYNRVNGHYCTQHQTLLHDTLRKSWGFEGLVLSDWGATADRVEALRAGMDLEMPGNQNAHKAALHQALDTGELPKESLKASAKRVITLLHNSAREKERRVDAQAHDPEAHHALAIRAAAAAIVLLKHDPTLLPLTPSGHIAVIGEMARIPRIQGNGSSRVVPTQVESAWDQLWDALQGEDVALGYAPGYERSSQGISQSLIDEASSVAQKADVTLLFLGLHDADESEGIDRPHLRLPPQQLALIEALHKANTKIVVVLSTGAPVLVPWEDKVQAIFTGYLGGQGSGAAIVDVLLGKVNPSGKLAETFPLEENDCPARHYFPGAHKQVEYREGIYVGYRYYDSFDKPVRYPFGHGLSYTTFVYDQLSLSHNTCDYTGDLSDPALRVTCQIKNDGERAGSEVVQLYAHFPESPIPREQQALKGFAKASLTAGNTQTLRFTLAWHQLALYDVETASWQVPAGPCEIRIGASSRDIRLRATVNITSAYAPSPTTHAYEHKMGSLFLADKDFAAHLGYPIPQPRQSEELGPNSTFGEARRTWLGKLIYWLAKRETQKALAGEEHRAFRAAIIESLADTPLRSMVLMSEGKVGFRQLERLLALMNRKFF